MNNPSDRQTAAPPARALVFLTALVLLLHGLMLRAAPTQWGMEASPGTRLRPLITRTIEIKPPSVAATASTVPTQPPVLRRNTAPSPAAPAQAAMEAIATPAPKNPEPTSPVAAAEASPPAVQAAPAAAPVAAVVALTIPGSVRLKYAMTGRSKNLDYSALAELEWLQDGQTYDAKMEVSALFLGSRSMSSSGRITADGLAPTRFADKSRSERAAHFEADKGKITFSANTPDAPLLRGAQDRLSVFLQLASLLAGDPASHPVGSMVSLYTVGPREADTWVFTVDAPETLSLPVGQMATLKLTRKPQREFDQTVEIWFAPSMDYLPVRSRITQQNGDFIDQQLRGTEKP
ncbi:DUF3108 domain-containing protein [Polaromonas sp.]|uniref:DUF3108 domain-containing protein n=1 Tax=Polaromonas sp. TaxID=1869339 RepID=UPI00273219B1|nr:DUF3108 domain-containing protein [Polaromonas sp.]MDP1740679.1 DUF3108 domain-containing protein [Polaromonas sp.]